MEHNGKAVIVDLDGTYILGNSLHIYISEGFKRNLRLGHIGKSLKIGSLIMLRMLRVISHKKMKFNCLELVPKDDNVFIDNFVARFEKAVNPTVRDFLSLKKNEGYRILLATAAPDTYIPYIWSGEYIATRASGNRGMVECRGEEKARRAREWLLENNLKWGYAVSDHEDDTPLFRENEAGGGVNMLVKRDGSFR